MRIFQSTFHAMGGENLIIVAAKSAGVAQKAIDAAAHEVLRIQNKYSRYIHDDTSIVHQINRRAGSGDWTPCDAETIWLLRLAGQFHKKSNGLFDITSGVLRRIWNFQSQIVPTPAQISEILTVIGWEKAELETNRFRLIKPGAEIDFGGFGKEYAADRAGMILRQCGIESGLVNLGGDVHAVGPQPDGKPWVIGVENPRAKGQPVSAIDIVRGGVATSGDSRNYFIKDGRRYSHIINPITGYPANFWIALSILHSSTLQAGFFSTTAVLMEERAEDFLIENKCQYFLIGNSGDEIVGA
jgi:FAD:protein FMN transferase